MAQPKKTAGKKAASKSSSRKRSTPRSSTSKTPQSAPKTEAPSSHDKSGQEITTLKNGDVVIDGVLYSAATAPVVPAAPSPEPVKDEPVHYIRNLRDVMVRIRFQSQDRDHPPTKLEARGRRGDLTRLRKEWADDPVLFGNLNHAVIELVTEAEAREIIAKQYTNSTQEIHPALAEIQGGTEAEVGHPVPMPQVQIDDPRANDITVAPLADLDGEDTGQIVWDRSAEGGGNIVRAKQVLDPTQVSDPYSGVPQERLSGQAPISVAAPGSSNNPTVQAALDENAPPEAIEAEIARLRDAQARSKGVSGPGAGVAGLRVEVEPVQRG